MRNETIQCIVVCITICFVVVAITKGQPFVALEKHNIDWETLVGVLGASIAAWATIKQTRKAGEDQIKANIRQSKYEIARTLKNRLPSTIDQLWGQIGVWETYEEIFIKRDSQRLEETYFLMNHTCNLVEALDKELIRDLGLINYFEILQAVSLLLKSNLETTAKNKFNLQEWQWADLDGSRQDIIEHSTTLVSNLEDEYRKVAIIAHDFEKQYSP